MLRESFDLDWRFALDVKGKYGRDADDGDWRRVDLPHDWSIELPRTADAPSGTSGGFARDGVGWYRKRFTLPEGDPGRRVYLEFEGIYHNAELWLNGRSLGVHPYGYTTFLRDLTPLLEPGENVLAVRVDSSSYEHTRWYSGSGIYRHVWLLTAGPAHIAHWGVSVTTPEVTDAAATVAVTTTVENHAAAGRALSLRWTVTDPAGKPVAESSAAVTAGSGTTDAAATLTVPAPQRWSPETPCLYRLETALYDGDACLDRDATTFGIRTLSFDVTNGFLLNGQSVKMRGGCVHHDCGPLGSAAIDRAEERKVERLKASGYNAVRTAHNPPSPAFLDACDRLGMLVMDEAFDVWDMEKIPYDYHRHFRKWWRDDLESMLRRDRNHPCVVIWSIGNELIERMFPEGAAIARMLADHVRAVDPTRPVTAGICGAWEARSTWRDADPLFEALDLRGYNYQRGDYQADHALFPEKVIVATETSPTQQYDYWKDVEALPYLIGDFVWTALDYLGEAGIGREFYEGENTWGASGWPWTVANCGDLDICYEKRPQSYYRDILWGLRDMPFIGVHAPITDPRTITYGTWGWEDVLASWTWPGCEGQEMPVSVYFDCDEVELQLNGATVGVAPVPAEAKYIAHFTVPYAPGELVAIARRGGAEVARAALSTTGAPSRLRLTADRPAIRADRTDLAFVTVEVCDADGRTVPTADALLHATLSGPGRLAAVANADPRNTELFTDSLHRAWRGRALVIVQPTGTAGEITLRVSADGLEPAEVVVACD
jgi:beta-galactosidase